MIKKNQAKVLLKIFVTTSLIGLLIRVVDWDGVLLLIGQADSLYVCLSVILMIAQFPVSSWKWKTSLSIHGIEYSGFYLLKILSIGFFINNFLPSSIGGDGYRVFRTFQQGRPRSASLSAVLLERAIGLVALVFLGSVGTFWLIFSGYGNQFTNSLFWICTTLWGMSLLGWFVLTRISSFPEWMVKGKFRFIAENMDLISRNSKKTAVLIMQSILFQMIAIAVILLFFKSLSLDVGWSKSAVIAVSTGIASVIPVSINGIGVTEGALVFSAIQVGIAGESAFLVALVMRVIVTIMSILCGVLYLYEQKISIQRRTNA